ncbi:MAG: DUF2244 domain-containing protein [Methylophilaceae bacterium]
MLVEYKIISKPNSSLTVSARVRVVLYLSILPLFIALTFAMTGLWIVLPFAGLELAALAYAFYYVNCHADDYESITITDNCLVVEKRNYKHTSQIVLNPYWAKVELQDAPSGNKRLWLTSHGKSIQVGHFMNNQERVHLAQQLQLRTGTTRNL